MKQVEFDIELVKKIQSGEIKGRVQTRDGRKARFLGVLKNNKYPLAFACKIYEFSEEDVLCSTINGLSCYIGGQSDDDIIIEIEEPKQKCQFKPFDKVLVRDEEYGFRVWQAAFYSHFYIGKDNGYHVTTAGDLYLDGGIIPYAGNEHLLGTTDKPKED